jgi:hypothetical protein
MWTKSKFALTIAAGCLIAARHGDARSLVLAVPGSNVAASSRGVELNLKEPLINFAVLVPCANGGAGEIVVLNGILHTVINTTIDATGGVHVKTHSQPQGLTGFGLDTGDKYNGVGVTQEQFNIGKGFEDTFVNNFRIIGQGPGNNFMVHQDLHVTVNANGTVTAFHDNLRITCS